MSRMPEARLRQIATDNAIGFNIAQYDDMLAQEVKTAFDKYDADGSGAIDKEELAALSKELGQELTAE